MLKATYRATKSRQEFFCSYAAQRNCADGLPDWEQYPFFEKKDTAESRNQSCTKPWGYIAKTICYVFAAGKNGQPFSKKDFIKKTTMPEVSTSAKLSITSLPVAIKMHTHIKMASITGTGYKGIFHFA